MAYGRKEAEPGPVEVGSEPSFTEMLKYVGYQGAKEFVKDIKELYEAYKKAFKVMFKNPRLFINLIKQEFKNHPFKTTASMIPFGGIFKDTLLDLETAFENYWKKDNPSFKDKEELAKNIRKTLTVALVSVAPMAGASVFKSTASKAARILEHFEPSEINKLISSPIGNQFLEATSLLEKAVEKGGKLSKEESKRLKSLMREIADKEPEAAKKLVKAYNAARIPSLEEITKNNPPGGIFKELPDSMRKTVENIVKSMDIGELKDGRVFIGRNRELAVVFEVIDKEGKTQKYIMGTGKIADKTNLIDITTGSCLGITGEIPLPKEFQGPQRLYRVKVLPEGGGKKTTVQ